MKTLDELITTLPPDLLRQMQGDIDAIADSVVREIGRAQISFIRRTIAANDGMAGMGMLGQVGYAAAIITQADMLRTELEKMGAGVELARAVAASKSTTVPLLLSADQLGVSLDPVPPAGGLAS